MRSYDFSSLLELRARLARFIEIAALLALVLPTPGCGAEIDQESQPTAAVRQGLCTAGDGGGDLGCGCTLNNQCNNYDEDTRLIVCDVPAGTTVGSCLDCVAKATGTRPVGCACADTTDCASGLTCNGRTCQPLRARSEYCFHDSDCGSDMTGTMVCLPTKSWCGPLVNGSYCDFQTDCLSGKCVAGFCTPGVAGTPCTADDGCTAPQVCGKLSGQCIDPQPDGKPCLRNAECQNQCNSFSGLCTAGTNGVICTLMNPAGPDGDCQTGLACTDCGGGAYTCRTPGGPCG